MASVTLQNSRLAIPKSLLASLPADLPKLSFFSVLAAAAYDNTFGAVSNGLRKVHLRNTLNALDDHILDDMGLVRGEIDAYIASTDKAKTGPSVWQLLQLSRIRRRSINELSQLSNRMLYDIGIERGEIESVVDRLIAAQVIAAHRAA